MWKITRYQVVVTPFSFYDKMLVTKTRDHHLMSQFEISKRWWLHSQSLLDISQIIRKWLQSDLALMFLSGCKNHTGGLCLWEKIYQAKYKLFKFYHNVQGHITCGYSNFIWCPQICPSCRCSQFERNLIIMWFIVGRDLCSTVSNCQNKLYTFMYSNSFLHHYL